MNGETRIIGLIGGKGGVGVSTVTQNLAVLLSEKGSVLVVDADCECSGDIARSFGCARWEKSFAEIGEILTKAPNMLKGYLNIGSHDINLIEMGENYKRSGNNFQTSVQFVSKLARRYAFVLFDFGASPDNLFHFVPLLSRVAVVSGVDFSSLSSTRRKISAINAKGVSKVDIDAVINNNDPLMGIDENVFEKKIGIKPTAILPNVGSRMVDLCLKGISFVDGGENHAFVHILRKYADGLTTIEIHGKSGFTCVGEDSSSGSSEKILRIKKTVMKRLAESKEIKKIIENVNAGRADRADLEIKLRNIVVEAAADENIIAAAGESILIKEIVDEVVGLGPIEKYMSDPEVSEIMVNASDEVYVERKGKIEKVKECFPHEKDVRRIIEKIVAPLGRRVDEQSPIVDARLPDGSRVHVVIPPLSLKGPAITIRKFRDSLISIEDLLSGGSMSEEMAQFLMESVKKKINILVSGGTGSGKTTLLNILSSMISNDERIITIEDSAELKLLQPHLVRLESRPANIEGSGEVTIRDLVRASLRMRPDRIIVGEVRGGEALDMLQAMNTGHDGSLTTIHANSCRDSLSRLETLVLFAGFDLPVRAIREQIVSALDIMVQLKRMKDGSRKIVNITEVTGLEGEVITTQELYLYEDGEFLSTGFRPRKTGR